MLLDWSGEMYYLYGDQFCKRNIVAGMPNRYIIFSEILPNTIGPALVYSTSVFALSILDEALVFLVWGSSLLWLV